MYKKSFLILSFSLICLIKASGQLASIELPKINPVDPIVAAFARYGDVPVDYSTGVPNISIPLFNIESNRFNIPVNISYHAAGIKVQDIATPVGLGWNLNVGAFVTCFYSRLDGWPGIPKAPYKTKADIYNFLDTISAADGASQMEQYKGDYYDLQSDRYYFNLGNGKSGVFCYDYLTDDLRMAPYSAIKIEKIVNGDDLAGFKIRDTDGSIYILDTYFSSGGGTYSGSFSYHASKIISNDLTDTISFSYTSGDPAWLVPVSIVREFGPWVEFDESSVGHDCTSGIFYNDLLNMDNTSTSQQQVAAYSLNITGISSRLGNYTFTYANDRADINKSRLISIEVTDKITNERKNKFVFEHSYFGTAASQNQRLRLDKIKIFGQTDAVVSQDYSFKYNSQALPKYHSIDYLYYSEDYWGYYNGNTGGGLVPSAFLPSNKRDIYCLFREPNHEFAKACMLEEIDYPTGGKTQFYFEPNEAFEDIYDYENDMAGYSSKRVGGFRIQQIVNYTDNNTIVSKKTYDYNGGGFARHITKEMFWYPQRYWFRLNTSSDFGCYRWAEFERYRDQYFGTPLSPLTIGSSSPVLYRTVTEYNGDSLNNTGKTKYSYELPKSYYDNTAIQPHPFSAREYYLLDRGTESSPLMSKEIFKKTDLGYQKVSSLFNTYTTFKAASFNTGLLVKFPTTYVVINSSLVDIIALDDGGPDGMYGKYWIEDTKIAQDVDLLTATVEEVDGLSKTTYFSYDALTHLQPKEQWTISSKGDTLKTKFKYPIDYAQTAVYDSMVARNIISPVIEQFYNKVTGTSNTFLNSTKTNFDFWNGTAWSTIATNIIVPRTVQTKTLNQGNYENRIKYDSYDNKANVTTVSKENDVKKTYLWGYNNSYPVAEIINADYATASAYVDQSILDNPADDATFRNHLANLRTIPKTQVTTYTYKPLAGITSETDAAGRTTYYEYDNFNRLSIIRDKDNNIIKKICYNYAGQPEQCNFYKSDPISGDYYSQNCPSGQAPVAYPVSLPQGMFTSYVDQQTANQLAQEYAQSQANEHGSCEIVNVSLYYDNQIGGPLTIQVQGASSGQNYSFTAYGHESGILGDVPPGTYNITINSTGYFAAEVGCGYYNEGIGPLTFYGISINSSCNLISIWQ